MLVQLVAVDDVRCLTFHITRKRLSDILTSWGVDAPSSESVEYEVICVNVDDPSEDGVEETHTFRASDAWLPVDANSS